MTYIWDTNILLLVVRKEDFLEELNKKYDFWNPVNKLAISVVTVGEIYSIAFKNRWGFRRMENLIEKINTLKIFPITEDPELIKMYSEIDVYSQSGHPTLRLPTSARKMGKNDLWIAATTAVHNAILVSTDADFDHLDGLFFICHKIIT